MWSGRGPPPPPAGVGEAAGGRCPWDPHLPGPQCPPARGRGGRVACLSGPPRTGQVAHPPCRPLPGTPQGERALRMGGQGSGGPDAPKATSCARGSFVSSAHTPPPRPCQSGWPSCPARSLTWLPLTVTPAGTTRAPSRSGRVNCPPRCPAAGPALGPSPGTTGRPPPGPSSRCGGDTLLAPGRRRPRADPSPGSSLSSSRRASLGSTPSAGAVKGETHAPSLWVPCGTNAPNFATASSVFFVKRSCRPAAPVAGVLWGE